MQLREELEEGPADRAQSREGRADGEPVPGLDERLRHAGKGDVGLAELGAKLPAVLERLRQTAAEIARDASSLEELNERVASGAGDQSEAVARTASAVEALSEKIDRISTNADEAARACEQARDEARQGLEQVSTVIEGMDRLLAQDRGQRSDDAAARGPIERDRHRSST